MVLLWCAVPALVLAVAAAVYLARTAKRQRVRADALKVRLDARDGALEHFVAKTLPSVAESLERPDAQVADFTAPRLENSRFSENLRTVADRYGTDLRSLRAHTEKTVREEVEAEAREAILAAEESTLARIETEAHDVTRAAVRSFGTSVVSLGADVGQIVSRALREHREDEVYETLTRIDHTVQQMIRQAQSYVIVCGGLPGRRWPTQTFTDVIGGAMGRVRDYTRVQPKQLERGVISRAVEPLVHTLATLLDNALRYSPPTSYVEVGFQEGHHGVTVIVDDAGVRMNAEQRENARLVLSGERPVDVHQLGPSPKVGFPGIAALARRYGFSVTVDGPNAYGGMRAMVFVPESLLVSVAAEREPVQAAVAAAASNGAVTAPAQVAAAVAEAEPADVPLTVEETPGGLPKRRRRPVAAPIAQNGRAISSEPARPGIAAAWHTGTRSGRAAASDHTEGTTS
ncbi:ATP-binding protein [Phytomonospora endophytica]|nr:ATP-binding protein [Phytomonospora endophytica]